MEELLNILKDLHPDVDFEKEEHLVDNKILDSFDIISVISEIAEQFDVVISAEYILPEYFNSAKALYALIEKLGDADRKCFLHPMNFWNFCFSFSCSTTYFLTGGSGSCYWRPVLYSIFMRVRCIVSISR